MEQTNLSWAGMLLGAFIAISSSIRYGLIWADPDKGFFFGLIGLMIIAISWNYAGRVGLQKEIEKLENTLTSVEEWIVDKNKKEENGGENDN